MAWKRPTSPVAKKFKSQHPMKKSLARCKIGLKFNQKTCEALELVR
jgi:hypothetical protein